MATEARCAESDEEQVRVKVCFRDQARYDESTWAHFMPCCRACSRWPMGLGLCRNLALPAWQGAAEPGGLGFCSRWPTVAHGGPQGSDFGVGVPGDAG